MAIFVLEHDDGLPAPVVRDGHAEDVAQDLEDGREGKVEEDVPAQHRHAHTDAVIHQSHDHPVEPHYQGARQEDPRRHHGEHG